METPLLTAPGWTVALGLGCIWHGGQMVIAGALPRALRRGAVPRAESGTPLAFLLWWIDQYNWIGLALLAGGVTLALFGLVAA